MAGLLLARWTRGVVVPLAVLACEERSPSLPYAAEEHEPPVEIIGSVRRPFETYLMTRIDERCEVTVEIDGEVVERAPERFACPRDLEVGERIRIAGMSCLREGGAAERRVPVVCPDYLTNVERARRKDAGR